MIVFVNFFTLHWQKFHSLSVDIITACPKALNSKAITDVLLSIDHFTVSDAILFGEGEGFGEGKHGKNYSKCLGKAANLM